MIAHRWYRARSHDAAIRIRHEVKQAIERIIKSPNRWPVLYKGARRVQVGRFPFSIVYRESSDLIEVIAVAHQMRRPNHWEDRLN